MVVFLSINYYERKIFNLLLTIFKRNIYVGSLYYFLLYILRLESLGSKRRLLPCATDPHIEYSSNCPNVSPDVALVSFDWDKIYDPSNGVNILRLESLTSTYKLLFSANEPQKVNSSICPGDLVFLVTPLDTIGLKQHY